MGRKGSMRLESRDPPKDTFRVPTECKYIIPSFQLNLERGWGKNSPFFTVKKGENILIPSPRIELGVDFLICFTTYDFLLIGLKKRQFLRFWPLSTLPPSNWHTTRVPTHIYPIRRFWYALSRVNDFIVRRKKNKKNTNKNKFLTWLKIVLMVFQDPKTDFVHIPPSCTVGRQTLIARFSLTI